MARPKKETVANPPEKKSEGVRKPRAVNNDKRKVYFASGKPDKTIPKLLIEGSWLREHGFEVGKTYNLTATDGSLVLEINE